jgi:TonB family protein
VNSGQQFGTALARDWTQWEGHVVDGVFPLRRCVSGSGPNAVFLTEYKGQDAAIKLVAADARGAELQLSRWQSATNLSHPHLLRLLHFDRCRLADLELVYVVMEWADESLAQVLPLRPLTSAETHELLEPALSVLAYLHRGGFVHGRLKPEKFLAVKDQLKISSDDLQRNSDSGTDQGIPPGTDVYSLGATVFEALTQGPPDPAMVQTLPEPFRTIVDHCLGPKPETRWTISQIEAYLRNPVPENPVPASRPVTRWRYGGALAALGLIVLAWGITHRARIGGPAATVTPATVSPATQPGLPPIDPIVDRKKPEPAAKPPVQDTNGRAAPGVLQEVLPEVPQPARNTIQGKVVVSVKIDVDPSGEVTAAKLESTGSSRYFADFAVKAARRWKFRPANVAQAWTVRFEFFRNDTKVFATRH